MNLSYVLLAWCACFLLIILLMVPFILYMLFGWSDTRRTILCRMREATVQLYFGFFPPDDAGGVGRKPGKAAKDADVVKRFRRFYDWHFGVRRFVIPALLFWTLAIGALVWCTHTVDTWLTAPAALPGAWVWLTVAALMGAFMRTAYDQIVDSVRREMAPSSLLWAAFRVGVAVPIGYSLATPLKSEFGPAMAFLLGFFPTRELFSFSRRVAVKRFDFGESGEAAENELQLRIQGVDQRQAERFADNRVTTVLQLAYSDPVKLAIRGGFEFDYVVDCISQALLWIYLEGDVAKVRKFGFRGAQEASNLWDEVQEQPPDELVAADARCAEAVERATQAGAAATAAVAASETEVLNTTAAVAGAEDALRAGRNGHQRHKLERALHDANEALTAARAGRDRAAAAALEAAGPALTAARDARTAAAAALQRATAACAATRAAAESAFAAAATALAIDPAAFRRTIGEVAEDPFVELIQTIWADSCDAEA